MKLVLYFPVASRVHLSVQALKRSLFALRSQVDFANTPITCSANASGASAAPAAEAEATPAAPGAEPEAEGTPATTAAGTDADAPAATAVEPSAASPMHAAVGATAAVGVIGLALL